jgi:para-nitrobenzyl esterase
MWLLLLVLASAAADLQVKTTGGVVQGFHAENVNQFLGIPYAVPPVGPLRWTAPRATSWTGVLNATAFGPSCIQPGLPGSEDCLTVNVFAPPNAVSAPVLFWIYGGGLTSGGSVFPLYDGSLLAAQGVVVVTFNYRLGLLGFISLPGLDSFATGAFGFLDQQLALLWTYANALSFGGDPNKITIFGESAGGSSVVYHLISRASWPFYARAIVESSAPIGESMSLADNLKAGVAFATTAGCSNFSSTVECMRALPAKALMPAVFASAFVAVNPEGPLSMSPVQAMMTGAMNPVPVLGGDVANEGTLFVYGAFQAPMSPAFYAAFVRQSVPSPVPPSVVDAALQLYPCAVSDCRDVASRLLGDFVFTCATNAVLLNHSGAAFSYAFKHIPSFANPQLGPNPTIFGAYHGSELPFVFDTLKLATQNYTQAETQLAADMSAAWVAFATSADPSIPNQPHFVPFSGASGWQRTAIDTGAWSVESDDMEKCSFWFDVYRTYL